MAEIDNEIVGPAHTAAKVEILAKMPARLGMISMVAIGPALLNAGMGVVRARVSFWQGEQELCGHEVLLHSMSVRGWADEVKSLIAGKSERDIICFSIDSPELMMTAWRYSVDTGNGPSVSYELLIALAAGVFDPSVGIGGGTGPGVFLCPEPEMLQQFAQDLLAETEEALEPQPLFGRKTKERN